eukprot:gnl/Dysnectes_brevis/11280_a23568_148.p1 GENE.gnl/Dysnectes_brevis/11280_a23568_148~~gnl/Dysnectes_brevis/11280_a23568_148.p1  ORF type:complete len:289 (+),score=-12.24 gnl/Dysnectes_brevis/11280_a23568_148:24-869(+)
MENPRSLKDNTSQNPSLSNSSKSCKCFSKSCFKLCFIIIFLNIVTVLVVFYIYTRTIRYKPTDLAWKSMESDSFVIVNPDDNGWITFQPNTNNTPLVTTGVIFYPGGGVDAESYAPILKSLATKGYFVVLIPMFLNLAIFSPNVALDVIDYYETPPIKWVLGGHSLGGSMSSSCVYKNPYEFEGLILLASYPAESNDLSTHQFSALQVISIYGSEDEVISKPIPSTKYLLPQTCEIDQIVGGNHAHFGDYGAQKGDGISTITRQEQQQLTVELIDTYLSSG